MNLAKSNCERYWTRSSFFLKTDGMLFAAGQNYGQFGDGTTTNRTTPVQVMSEVKAVTTCFMHSFFLKSDGTLLAAGNNQYGQLGDGTYTSRLTPVRILP